MSRVPRGPTRADAGALAAPPLNPLRRPAGILVPECQVTGLVAGCGQIEAQVIRVDMVGEVTCPAIHFAVIRVVVTGVQDVVASGQIRPTDQLEDVAAFARPGTITASVEPLSEGGLGRPPQGSACIVNACASYHGALRGPETGAFRASLLHETDAAALVHAALLRLQARVVPVRTLVLSGGR